jgi:DNA-binding CsgD family transcriptional regulator
MQLRNPDCSTQKEKILALSSYGYSPTDISRMLHTSVNTVNNALSRARKEKTDSGKEVNESESSEQKNE